MQAFSPRYAGFFLPGGLSRTSSKADGLLCLCAALLRCSKDVGKLPDGRAMDALPCNRTTMILYKPGAQFLYKGRLATVDFVIIRKTGLWIRLAHSEEVCRPEDLTPVTPASSHIAEDANQRM